MTEHLLHPPPEQLEEYAAELLPDGDRAVLDSHLLTCERCRSELEEVRSLFSLLSGLPRVEPSAGFADRVMLRVQRPHPWASRATAWIKGLLPGSTFGLSLATAFLALPMLLGSGLIFWLTTMPGVTLQGLWLYGQARLGQALLAILGRSLSLLLESDLVLGLAAAAQSIASARGAPQLAVLAGAVGLLSIVSAWVLYTNLVRTPSRELPYAR